MAGTKTRSYAADYSDPDILRVGQDYYLTASSFHCMPGLPILHSRDLVNWKLIGHALQQQVPWAQQEWWRRILTPIPNETTIITPAIIVCPLTLSRYLFPLLACQLPDKLL